MNEATPCVHAILYQYRVRTGADSQNNLQFVVRPSTKFSFIKDHYCKELGIEATSVRLLFDGNRIAPDATPHSLQIDSNDT